jgi:hypothetical protein
MRLENPRKAAESGLDTLKIAVQFCKCIHIKPRNGRVTGLFARALIGCSIAMGRSAPNSSLLRVKILPVWASGNSELGEFPR